MEKKLICIILLLITQYKIGVIWSSIVILVMLCFFFSMLFFAIELGDKVSLLQSNALAILGIPFIFIPVAKWIDGNLRKTNVKLAYTLEGAICLFLIYVIFVMVGEVSVADPKEYDNSFRRHQFNFFYLIISLGTIYSMIDYVHKKYT